MFKIYFFQNLCEYLCEIFYSDVNDCYGHHDTLSQKPFLPAGHICTFMNYESFKTHVYRDHAKYSKSNCLEKYRNMHFSCNVNLCNFTCNDISDFFGQSKMHLCNNAMVKCPFEKCEHSFTVVSSFSSHMSRSHRNWKVGGRIVSTDADDVVNTNAATTADDRCIFSDFHEVSDQVQIAQEDSGIDEDMYMDALVLFYMQLQAKLLLLDSAIQDIITQFQNIHVLGQDILTKRLVQHLQLLDVPEETARKTVKIFNKNDTLHMCNSGALQIHVTRQTSSKPGLVL